jgi:hypothetical protein
MEATIETDLSPATVWAAWEKAHAVHSSGGAMEPGHRAKSTGFKYAILDVVPGESFSILWKSYLVRIVFIHTVHPTRKGSKICYRAEMRGLFARPVRFFLAKKVQKNLSFVLKEFVKNLRAYKQ